MDNRQNFPTPEDIASHYTITNDSLRFYYSAAELYFHIDIEKQQSECLKENDHINSLALLASLEAMLQRDYLSRAHTRGSNDPLTKSLRNLYRQHEKRVRLEDDIIRIWTEHTSEQGKKIFQALKDALKYRHWLAHGRYWEPKLGRKYDFFSIYTLVNAISPLLRTY